MAALVTPWSSIKAMGELEGCSQLQHWQHPQGEYQANEQGHIHTEAEDGGKRDPWWWCCEQGHWNLSALSLTSGSPILGPELRFVCSWRKGDSRWWSSSREERQQQPKFGKYICTLDILLEEITGKTGGILFLRPRKWRLLCMTNYPLASFVEEAMSFPQLILFSLWSKMEVKPKTKLGVQFPIHSH